ncbi:MAG: glycosyl transferase [Clostridiales bacterium]|nr:glycosyl transferase [Clostridiales bacterium]
MIPKTVHYCWFGRGEKPKLVKKCIETWKKYLPDYALTEWNEDNFDINSNLFVKQAYEHKNFAFVSDFVRAKALYENGGVYLDTDVEVLKGLDRFLSDKMFVGFEEKNFVGTCVMGAEKGSPILLEYTAHYEGIPYVSDDGEIYKKTNVLLLTEMLEKKGLKRDDSFQTVDGVSVYPRTFFSPYDYINGVSYITDESCTIHHFAQLWLPKSVRMKTELKRAAIKIIGGERFKKIMKR